MSSNIDCSRSQLGSHSTISASSTSHFQPSLQTSETNRTGVGFWTQLHYVMLQCGYDWYDETDACLKGMKFRLKTLASDLDPETAREEYNRLKDEWEAYEDEFEAWLAEHPEGEAEEL